MVSNHPEEGSQMPKLVDTVHAKSTINYQLTKCFGVVFGVKTTFYECINIIIYIFVCVYMCVYIEDRLVAQ